jgi:putative ABC transport system permease protein
MNIGESIGVSLTSLRVNKLRSVLTVLGIIIGVMTVIGMISLIEGMNRTVTTQLGALGATTIYVSKYPWISTGEVDWMEIRKRRDLTLEDGEAIRQQCTAVRAVAPSVDDRDNVRHGRGEVKRVPITGTTPDAQEIGGQYPEAGRFFTETELDRSRYVCLLGPTTAEELFSNLDPVGREVTIGLTKFSVIGVLEKKGKIFGFDADNTVIIPISTFVKLYGKRSWLTLSVQPRDFKSVELAKDQITELLRRRRHVPPSKPNDFELNTQSQFIDLYKKLTAAIYAVMIGVASLSLLVGGIGIMNIMLVSVTERTREIGIRKALGARRHDIRWQFLIEAVVLSCVGGVIGILAGFSIAKAVSAATRLPSSVSLWSVLLGFGFSSLVGIIFGFFPAAKAARLDPIEALRHE